MKACFLGVVVVMFGGIMPPVDLQMEDGLQLSGT